MGMRTRYPDFEHITRDVAIVLIQGKNLPQDVEAHIHACERCQALVDVLREARALARHRHFEMQTAHFSRLALSEAVTQIYEGSLPTEKAEAFLAHVSLCNRCFDYLGQIFSESFSPYADEDTALYDCVDLADRVYTAVPPERVEPRARQPQTNFVRALVEGFQRRRAPWLTALSVIGLLVILLLGIRALGHWQARQYADQGMQTLQENWTVPLGDWRPPGDLSMSPFSVTRSAEPSEEKRGTAADFARALEWHSGSRQARLGLAVVSYFTRQWDRADSLTRVLLEDNPRDAEAWNLRGVLALARQDTTAALHAFLGALALDPNYPEAAYNRAMLLEELGGHKAAREAWEIYLRTNDAPDWQNMIRRRLERPQVE